MKTKCFMCNKRKDSYFGTTLGTDGINQLTEEAQRLSKLRKSKFICDDCYSE